jgi:hypothetical protein
MTPAPEPGIYPGVPYAEYAQWDAVNSSFLWRLRTRSPRHAQYEREHPKDPTPALKFGILLHLAVLEPARFDESTIAEPEDAPRRPSQRQRDAKKPSPSTIESIEYWDEWEEKAAGKLVVTAGDSEKVREMDRAIRIQQCSGYVTGGRAEVCLVWRDKDTGILCKGRLDYLHEGWDVAIVDLKTTEDASYDAFQRDIYSYGYFQTAAFYMDGYEAITGVRPKVFTWLAVEKEPPYVAKPWDADERLTIRPGQASYSEALERYVECVAKNEWPAYGDGPGVLGLSPWALRREGFDLMLAGAEKGA